MKAGAFTPAILVEPVRDVVVVVRSMKAGAFTPAIPGRGDIGPIDVHERSMKAGAFTPAIPSRPSRRTPGRPSLNEGGGLHPRNPWKPLSAQSIRNLAQ